MVNPWINLPVSEPFVLESDKGIIESFNKTSLPECRIDLSLPPEPFIGRLDAPVILLSLNPGLTLNHEVDLQQFRLINNQVFNNLNHVISDYPFYYLNPVVKGFPGSDWWRAKLKRLINLFGDRVVANKLMVVELFPYHSFRAAGCNLPRVPSQHYSFSLVRQFINDDRLIIVMRSESEWLRAVPELINYDYLSLRNKQGAFISPGNLPDGSFNLITELFNQ